MGSSTEYLDSALVPDAAKNLSHFPFVKEQRQLLPYLFVKKRALLPLEEREGKIFVALCNPYDLEALEEGRHLLQRDLEELIVSKEVLEEAIELCYNQKENTASDLIANLPTAELTQGMRKEIEGYDLLDQDASSAVIRILNAILSEAIQQGASDIHFEPKESGLTVRYRIDGVLQQRHAPPREVQSQLITRIKVLAKLDIAERRLPQDGRIKLTMGEREIDFRVSTIPVAFGERIVLRILEQKSILLGLSQLGIGPSHFSLFRRLINCSEGVVLVTGPTGSGKTTTLYSALHEINSQEMNIMTIEDPVEFKLQGIAQIGVNPKIHLSFAAGLRHILRQDPDVIMIGEIRDKETAEIAIQAALTGHLVLSTLHTNDAPSALTRLVDMGVEPYLLSSTVIGVLAQRLVRKICPQCKESYIPSDEELHELRLARDELIDGFLFRGAGCAFCFQTGYKGRHGVYELMEMSSSLKKSLHQSPDATALKMTAQKEGMSSLREEGSRLVRDGITTTAELLRATKGGEE